MKFSKSLIKFMLFLALVILSKQAIAQQITAKNIKRDNLSYFVELSLGTQMSGIKSEDFVKSNYSPLINFTVGKWFVPYLALQFGYKGYYFNQISDELKHHYNFYYGEALLNFQELFYLENKVWSLILHAGAGYFYNYSYNQPNICATVGVKQKINIAEQWAATIDVSSIMGWDIYQGDQDILPGITLGVVYSFKL